MEDVRKLLCDRPLLVNSFIKDTLLDKIEAQMREWPMGERLDPEAWLGGGTKNRTFAEETVIELPGNEHRLAREEICVAVLSVIEISSFDEASSVASDDDYCLCASILTANGKRALRGARMLRAGNVTVTSCGEGVYCDAFPALQAIGL